MSQIILASGSPRRKELLEQIGLEFEICPAKGEERITGSRPEQVVTELSKQKAEEIASGILGFQEKNKELTTPREMLVIGADTVVAYEGKILGKPKDAEDAKRMLTMLSGNTHSVYTGVTVVVMDGKGRCGEHSFFEKTDVTMYPMTGQEIEEYIATGEPMDKAGAYGIQGACASFVKGIRGDYNNVVGLPLARLYQELKRIGIDLHSC